MRKFLFAILLTLAVSVFPACGDNIPQGLPERFFLGLASHPDELDWMVRSGIPWDARYYYFTGGVNTGGSWSVWYPDGNFASTYMESSARNGYLPVITYYQMVKSKPAIGQNEAEQDYNNLNNPETMSAYFADFKLLMQKAKAFGKPVIVHVEPDLWGYMQQRINGADNPSAVSAAVSSSGFKDVKGLPNNLVGFGRALIKLRDLYARNVILATHASPWATNFDVTTDKSASLDVEGIAGRTARFLKATGNWDLVFADPADRDAAYYEYVGKDKGGHWWDKSNQTYPNFARFAQYLAKLSSETGKRIVLWQVPLGNTLMRSSNNAEGHYQDNRVEYFLEEQPYRNVAQYADVGVIGILFGRGAPGPTSYTDDAKDGVTNPPPVNGNDRRAAHADDDGGYLRTKATAYYAAGAYLLPGARSQVSVDAAWFAPLIPLAMIGAGIWAWRRGYRLSISINRK